MGRKGDGERRLNLNNFEDVGISFILILSSKWASVRISAQLDIVSEIPSPPAALSSCFSRRVTAGCVSFSWEEWRLSKEEGDLLSVTSTMPVNIIDVYNKIYLEERRRKRIGGMVIISRNHFRVRSRGLKRHINGIVPSFILFHLSILSLMHMAVSRRPISLARYLRPRI